MPARRKRSNPERLPLKGARLFIDDLEHLVELLDPGAGSVSIELPDYELDEPADLAELPRKRYPRLNIEVKSPRISIHLGSTTSFIALHEDTLEARRLAGVARDFLDARRRWHFLLGIPAILYSIGTGIGAWVGIIDFEDAPLWVAVTVVAVSLAACPAGLYWVLSGETVVNTRRHGDETWYSRNRDQILLGIIFGLIFTVLGVVIGKLTP